MFRSIAALALASATAQHSPTLLASAPWWERVTVTISGDGKPQSCQFESSLKTEASQTCNVVGNDGAIVKSSGAKDQYTRITFERRFSPGGKPDAGDLQPGEILIGGQVMALGIDPRGQVKSCKIVSQSGSMQPQYGCEQASAERFQASAAANASEAPSSEAYMTVVVYGHSEHVV